MTIDITPVEVRFWKKVDVGKDNDCWIWKGSPSSTGYGLIGLGGRGAKRIGVHRLSWEIHNGPIPKREGHHGAVIMHTCDNRLCVNPKHLVCGTQADNVRDMDKKGRRINSQCKGATHPNSKLTAEQVVAIRKDPRPHTEVAREYSVTRQCISYVRTVGWQSIG